MTWLRRLCADAPAVSAIPVLRGPPPLVRVAPCARLSESGTGQDGLLDWSELMAALRPPPHPHLPEPRPAAAPAAAAGQVGAAEGGGGAGAIRDAEEECVRRRGEGGVYRAGSGGCVCGEGFTDGPEGPGGPCVPDLDKACQVASAPSARP